MALTTQVDSVRGATVLVTSIDIGPLVLTMRMRSPGRNSVTSKDEMMDRPRNRASWS